jgi:hypothetical protein
MKMRGESHALDICEQLCSSISRSHLSVDDNSMIGKQILEILNQISLLQMPKDARMSTMTKNIGVSGNSMPFTKLPTTRMNLYPQFNNLMNHPSSFTSSSPKKNGSASSRSVSRATSSSSSESSNVGSVSSSESDDSEDSDGSETTSDGKTSKSGSESSIGNNTSQQSGTEDEDEVPLQLLKKRNEEEAEDSGSSESECSSDDVPLNQQLDRIAQPSFKPSSERQRKMMESPSTNRGSYSDRSDILQ